ncbi:MAG: hypothetical protein K0S33_1223 [Bacteroidetes bacterium]|jgi:hypothetical protein|nr:hypothetical protein [Bacteroidota bacterium]
MKTTAGNLSKAKNIFIGGCAAAFMLMSCGSSSEATPVTGTDTAATVSAESKMDETHFKMTDLVDLDLSSYGIPLITKAPKGSKVMKYEVSGEICVYGGKFFKTTFSSMEGTIDENLPDMKTITGDKELNPGFDKFEVEDKNGFLKKNTKGELAFLYYVEVNGASYMIKEGMPFDISPDQFTDYGTEDVKLMYEAAKSTIAK